MIRLPASVKWIVASAHPAYAMRGLPQSMPHIQEAISRGKRFGTGVETRRRIEVMIRPSPDALRAYLATRAEGAPIFIDVETPMHEQGTITIVGISVSRWTAAVVPWIPEYADIIADILADPKVVKGGHNFAYDRKAFWLNGCEVAWPVVDTIQAEALLYPPFKEAAKRRWLALATCVLRRFPGPHWKNPDDPRTRLYFEMAYPEVPQCFYGYLYCGLDVGWNWLLWERQREELEKRGMLRLFREVVAPAGYVFAGMEIDGIPVDTERLRQRTETCQKRIADLEAKITAFTAEYHARRVERLAGATAGANETVDAAIAAAPACASHPDYRGLTNRSRSKCEGCKATYAAAAPLRERLKELKDRARTGRDRLKKIGEAFDAGNDHHWRYLLFQPPPLGLGLIPTRVTGKAGLEGVGKDDITELARMYPDVECLAWRQEIQHRMHQMAFVYAPPVVNGRRFGVWPLHKAENGRLASGSDLQEPDKPRPSDAGNLQNITEVDRQIFAAPPGMKWVEMDGSQFELRAMAWQARAVNLLTSLANGEDVHSENAEAIFGCKKEDAKKTMVWFEGMWQDARRAGKRPTHGWDYGLGDVKCGKMFKPMAGKPLPEIKEFLAGWFERTGGKDGVSSDSWDRRWRAAERAADPDLEKRKFVMRRFEEANTLRAREWRLAYFAKRPELATFQRVVIDAVTAKGDHVLTNPFGRQLKFWGFRWNFAERVWEFTEREEALAFLPASTVGDMAKALMAPLAEIARKHGGWLVHMGHDSFSACIPDANVEAYAREAKAAAEREWPELGRIEPFGLFRCPFEVKVGQNWGPAHAHAPECRPDCEKANPDGLRAWKEAA